MDPHLLKKAILMTSISISKTHFRINFPFLVILMAYISNDGTHNYQKRKILMAGITVPKTILKQIFLFRYFDRLYKYWWDPQLPKKENLINYIIDCWTQNYQKRKIWWAIENQILFLIILMEPTAIKNEKFNELYNYFKNHFRIIFPFLIIVGLIW